MARKYTRKTTNDSVPQVGKALSQEVSKNPAVPMETARSMLMNKAMADRSHRIDLPDAMREKMEAAFGMNFGKVNLYESERVADAGMNAIAQGGNIAFAPGKDDFNSLDGQRRLGHELSHIASQARGEVTGSGYLDNGALEARADREGAMAASGEQAYSGPVMDAPSFSAAAPMQAEEATSEDIAKRMMDIKAAMRAQEDLYKASRLEPADEQMVTDEDKKWYKQMIANPNQQVMEFLMAKKTTKMIASLKGLDAFEDKNPNITEEGKQKWAFQSNAASHAMALQDILSEYDDYHADNKGYASLKANAEKTVSDAYKMDPRYREKMMKNPDYLAKKEKSFNNRVAFRARSRFGQIKDNSSYDPTQDGYEKFSQEANLASRRHLYRQVADTGTASDMLKLYQKNRDYNKEKGLYYPGGADKYDPNYKKNRKNKETRKEKQSKLNKLIKEKDEQRGSANTIDELLDRMFDMGKISRDESDVDNLGDHTVPLTPNPVTHFLPEDSELGVDFQKALLERRNHWRDAAIKEQEDNKLNSEGVFLSDAYRNAQAYNHVADIISGHGMWDDEAYENKGVFNVSSDESEQGKKFQALTNSANNVYRSDPDKKKSVLQKVRKAHKTSVSNYGKGDTGYAEYQKEKQEQARKERSKKARMADEPSALADIIARQKMSRARNDNH